MLIKRRIRSKEECKISQRKIKGKKENKNIKI
jgi:hypothetical protein